MAVTNTQLAQYALATFGIAPGGFNTTLSTFANANGEVALLNALLELPASPFGNVTNNGAFALSLVQNVIGDTATAANKNLLVSLIATNLDAGVSRGQMVKALVDALAAMPTTDANWGTAAATFTNKVTVGEYYTTKGGASTDLTSLTSIVSSVTSDAATVTSAKSGIDNGYAGYNVQTLTTGTDTFTGTSGNDMFVGTTLDTLNAADSLSDSSTTDADILTAAVSGAVTVTGKIAGVETVNLTGKYGSVGLGGAGKLTGIKQLNLDSSIAYGTATVTEAGAASIAAVKAGTNISSLSVTNSSSGGAVSVDAGAATAVTVDGGSAADTFTLTMAKGNSNTLSINGGASTDAYTLNLAGGTLALSGNTNNETLNIAVSGAAQTINANATVSTTAGSAGTITLSGDQSITLKDTAANLAGVTLTDNTTGTAVSTVRLTSVGGAAADLSKVAADKFEIVDVDTTGSAAVTFANDAKLLWSDSAAASLKLASTTAGAGTLNITANAAEVKFEDGGNEFAKINVAVDTATRLTAKMAAATTDLVLSGAKDVTVDDTSTAKSLDASALTGKLTIKLDGTSDITTITGGSGNDSLTTGSTASAVTAALGAGDDTVVLGATPSTNKYVLDGGTGNDTLKANIATIDFSTNTAKDSVITGFETIDVNGKTLTLTQKQLFTNGNTFTLVDTSAAGGGGFVVKDDGSSSKVFDLSGIQLTAGVAAPTISIDVFTANAATSVTGSAAADSILGSASADTINGGAGNDSITGGNGGDIINVGTGTDTVVFGATGQTFSGAVASGTTVLTGVDVISGMAAGDILSVYAGVGIASGGSGTTVGTSLMSAGTVNAVAIVKGNYNTTTGIFTTNASGTDSLVQWDSNGATSAGNVESVVLVGFAGTLSATAANTLTLA